LAITRCGWSGWSWVSIGVLAREHRVDEQPVAPRGGDAAGAGVGAGDQTQLFQVGHHVADGGGREIEPGSLGKRARADGLPVGDVALDQRFEKGSGSLVQHGFSL
jgi:hypothetical protein